MICLDSPRANQSKIGSISITGVTNQNQKAHVQTGNIEQNRNNPE